MIDTINTYTIIVGNNNNDNSNRNYMLSSFLTRASSTKFCHVTQFTLMKYEFDQNLIRHYQTVHSPPLTLIHSNPPPPIQNLFPPTSTHPKCFPTHLHPPKIMPNPPPPTQSNAPSTQNNPHSLKITPH